MAFSAEDFDSLGRTLESSMNRGVERAVQNAIRSTADSQTKLQESTTKLQASQIELIKAVENLSILGSSNVTLGGGTSSSLNTTMTPAHKEQAPTTLSEIDSIKWYSFKSNFIKTSKMNEWKDERAVLKLQTSLRDQAARAVEHIPIADDCTLKDALEAMETVFVNPSAVEYAEAMFYSSARQPGEAIILWHTRVRELFLRAYPSATAEEVEENKTLKDRFSLFIHNRAMTLALKNHADYRMLTFTELLTRAQDYQASILLTQQAYEGKAIPSSIQEITPGSYEEATDEAGVNQITANMHRTDPSPMPRNTAMTCFHCNEKGHGIRECPTLNKALERIRRRPQSFGLALANKTSGGTRTTFSSRGTSGRRGMVRNRGRNKGKSPYYTFQMVEEEEGEEEEDEEEEQTEN